MFDNSYEKANAEKLEAANPTLKFSRDETCNFLSWGIVPVQATGTYNGMPFYFRERHEHATLRVWNDRPGLDPTKAPYLVLSPALFAEADTASLNSEGSSFVKLFQHLLNDLKPETNREAGGKSFWGEKHSWMPLPEDVRDHLLRLGEPVRIIESEDLKLSFNCLYFYIDSYPMSMQWNPLYFGQEDSLGDGEPVTCANIVLSKHSQHELQDEDPLMPFVMSENSLSVRMQVTCPPGWDSAEVKRSVLLDRLTGLLYTGFAGVLGVYDIFNEMLFGSDLALVHREYWDAFNRLKSEGFTGFVEVVN